MVFEGLPSGGLTRQLFFTLLQLCYVSALWTVVNEGKNQVRLHNNYNYLTIVNGHTTLIHMVGLLNVGKGGGTWPRGQRGALASQTDHRLEFQ
jgi:hypothetical protein